MKNIAFITGITGQDGAYLADFLLKKGYIVHGLQRSSSLCNLARIKELYNLYNPKCQFFLHYGDLKDASNLIRLLAQIKPTEIYNLAAQSHVHVSFLTPIYTANIDALGVLNLLETIRILKLEKDIRFYQASTSELYGKIQETPQKETTPFYPRSPYAVAKLYAYWITVNYREAYNIHASNGILFNHESPFRGEHFVTRKITKGVAAIYHGKEHVIELGNLEARRDWGHAKEYVDGMWRILQQDKADDYVLATGTTHSVRKFVELAFLEIGIEIMWQGKAEEERGINPANGKILVTVSAKFFRPAEVDLLLGDATKAKETLGWIPKVTLSELVKEMVAADIKHYRQD